MKCFQIIKEKNEGNRKNISAIKSLNMQNVWASPSCLRPRLSQTTDHRAAQTGPMEIIYTTPQRRSLHTDRSIRYGKRRAAWFYHTESGSHDRLNNAHKLNWLWCAWNNDVVYREREEGPAGVSAVHCFECKLVRTLSFSFCPY